MKRQDTDLKKIFAIQMSRKQFIYGMYQKLLHLIKKPNNKSGQKILLDS